MSLIVRLHLLLRPVAVLFALMPALSARADEVQAMKTALQLMATKDWDGALAVAPSGVGRDVVLWTMLRDGTGTLGDYEDFLARRPDWPGLPLLKQKGEAAAARSTTPARVAGFFGKEAPATAEGAIALVRALLAQGDRANAETEAMRAWADLAFTSDEEKALIALLPEAVAAADRLRLENLLWAGRRAEALRMLPRVPTDVQALARARMALRADENGVDALIKAVPPALADDPGLAYERFVWRMRRDLYEDAAALLLAQPADRLGRPEAWAERRALLARWLMRQGRAADAYKIAAAHGLSAGASYADLEFLAGFIALRRLNQPDTALQHFSHLLAGVSTPISLSRAAYWQGRAEEARGNVEAAESHFLSAARHQTAYYGLLAAEKLDLPLNPALLEDKRPADWRQARFAGSSVLAAGRLLAAAGDRALAKRFFLHLGEGLTDAERVQLADMAMQMQEPNIALLIAKQAAERGAIIPWAYFPVPAFVPDGLAVSRALALAIARRESEFDPAARSHANAQGLMQVLPETGQRMARDIGLEYTPGRLLTDPAFNVTVGAAYLGRMVEEFGPAIALVASGYNAGPGRPRRWITEFGDPRQADVDVVDWVETIPFGETRTYVMRVVEGVVIYRAKLKGEAGPIRITAELKG
ncbi:lytic transglycosylase domain-containing protein [Neotabrizicola sp. VNH66]|uniref:lytic transglycosylase domain-containing protein n=1 Tax=Neotabrizicola sp. VNH66 TaxID=3400918 RepID=UPI003C0A6DD5